MGKSCKFSTAGMDIPLQGTIAYQARMKQGIPGPNTYNPSDPNAKLGGGKFNKSSGMSYIDLAVMKGKGIPGPASYGRPQLPGPSGGKFNTGNSKGEIDWAIYKAKGQPGPADYGAPQLPGPRGGKFNSSNSKSDVDWMIFNASRQPGPGQYGAPDLPGAKGGKFSTSKPKSDVDWKIYNASRMPGPSSYNVAGRGINPTGGKFNLSKAKSSTEWEMYRASKIPGPGQYRPEAVEAGYTGLKDGFGEGLSHAVRFGDRPVSPDMPMVWAHSAAPEPVSQEKLQETHHSLMKRLNSAKATSPDSLQKKGWKPRPF